MTALDKAKVFWKWFDTNKNQYYFINKVEDQERDRLFEIFISKLHEYNEEIYFEMGRRPDEEKMKLIITAEGIIKHFDAVEFLIKNAPEFPNWEMIAFKPPKGKGLALTYRGVRFSPTEIIFIPLVSEDDPSAVGINVCYPDYENDDRDIYVNGTYLILDVILGEKSVALDIDYLEVIRTPENISDFNFKSLNEIREFIDQKKKV